jgi:hypothetical protein
MSKKYTTSETCIYCGGKAGSEEHVFPQWLRERFTGSGTIEHQVNISSPVRFMQGVKDVRIVVRSVCKTCNGRWMSVLQNEAKPIIEGLLDETFATLILEDCRLLTSWAVMSAMCLETRNERTHWLYNDLVRTLFYKNKSIPDNTDVWLCCWVNSPGPSYEVRKSGGKDISGYVFTFGFGNLVFQVLHWMPIDSHKQQPKRITIEEPWDEVLIPIRYPKDSAINWRPKKGIDGEVGFKKLESRFLRTVE